MAKRIILIGMKITTQIKVVTLLGLLGFKCLSWRRRLAHAIAESLYKEVQDVIHN